MDKEVALIPFTELQAMAQVMGKTGMFGKSPDQLLSLMLIAQAEGIHPAIASQEYDIIQGKPAINSRAALARFQAAGGSIQWITRTAQEATAVFSHPQGGQLQITWTMARAEQAGLAGKDLWKKYPEAMLSARVVAEGVRAVYPAALSRLYTVEEVQDFDLPKTRDVTPHPEAPRTTAPGTVKAEVIPDDEAPPIAHVVDKIDPIQATMSEAKAEISTFVTLVGEEFDGKALFSDEEKAFYKAKIAAVNEAVKQEKDLLKAWGTKRDDIRTLNEAIREELRKRKGHTELSDAMRDALNDKKIGEQQELG
jgi:hypothetical protein